jgi:hypothetical protein
MKFKVGFTVASGTGWSRACPERLSAAKESNGHLCLRLRLAMSPASAAEVERDAGTVNGILGSR